MLSGVEKSVDVPHCQPRASSSPNLQQQNIESEEQNENHGPNEPLRALVEWIYPSETGGPLDEVSLGSREQEPNDDETNQSAPPYFVDPNHV